MSRLKKGHFSEPLFLWQAKQPEVPGWSGSLNQGHAQSSLLHEELDQSRF